MNSPTIAADLRPARIPAAAGARRRLVAGFSIEATPKQLATAGSLAGRLPPATRVYVPWLPRAAAADAVRACAALSREGFAPVPHIAVRAIGSRARLDDHLGRFAEAGARSILLIAGDRPRAAGPFASTLDVLGSGLLERNGFAEIGVAGHPEGHPVADERMLLGALRAKQEYARATGGTVRIVTQFAFVAAPVTEWLQRLRAEGIGLPVRIGVPGPAKPKTLLRYALSCGVAASSRLLARRPDAAIRLLGRWTPDTMLSPLALHAEGDGQVEGVHVFPFGGLLQSLGFFSAIADEGGH